MDFGNAGSLRLFTQPLVGEASWLLPFVLGGLVILLIALWKRPLDDRHVGLILWAVWLLPEAIYFTYSTGLMHAYYLIMLGAPLAALAGMTGWAAWQVIQERRWLGWGLSILLVAGTLAFEGFTLWGTTQLATWAIGAAGLLFGLGLALPALSLQKARLAPLALGLLLAAMLAAPMLWSGLTSFNASTNNQLPAAGPATTGNRGGMPGPGDGSMGGSDQGLLTYLLANTPPGTYLLATDRASDAATYILATGRPVLTFGGFLGQYNEVSVDQLAALVKGGKLRFVLSQSLQGHQEIAQWVRKNCTQVNISASHSSLPDSRQSQSLYDCGGSG